MTLLAVLGFVPGIKADDCHVSFEFDGEGAERYITRVAPYGGDDIADFANGFDVPASTYLQLYVESEDPNMTVTANGEAVDYSSSFGSYGLSVKENTVIEVKALVAPTIEVTCNDIKGVDFGYWKDFGDYGKYPYALDLTENGTSTFTMESAAVTEVYVRAKEGYTVSVKVDGEDVSDTEYIAIKNGSVIDITVEAADCHVSFVFDGEGADKYITRVAPYNGEDIADFANGFDIAPKTYLQLYVDKVDAKMSVTANGEQGD